MPAKQPPKPKRLKTQHFRFVQEYLRDQNGKRAAIRAGYAESGAAKQAWELLNTPRFAHVRAAVDQALADEAKANAALRARIREELCAVAFSRVPELLEVDKLADLDETQQAAVAQVSYFTDSGQNRTLARLRPWSKTQALALLLKNFAMPLRSQGADDITRAIDEVESGLDQYEAQLEHLSDAVLAAEQPESP